jgi:hypothetical protein
VPCVPLFCFRVSTAGRSGPAAAASTKSLRCLRNDALKCPDVRQDPRVMGVHVLLAPHQADESIPAPKGRESWTLAVLPCKSVVSGVRNGAMTPFMDPPQAVRHSSAIWAAAAVMEVKVGGGKKPSRFRQCGHFILRVKICRSARAAIKSPRLTLLNVHGSRRACASAELRSPCSTRASSAGTAHRTAATARSPAPADSPSPASRARLRSRAEDHGGGTSPNPIDPANSALMTPAKSSRARSMNLAM